MFRMNTSVLGSLESFVMGQLNAQNDFELGRHPPSLGFGLFETISGNSFMKKLN
jgi:hypothetical protein